MQIQLSGSPLAFKRVARASHLIKNLLAIPLEWTGTALVAVTQEKGTS